MDTKVIAQALAGMSVDQLIELKTTAHRLKHLPFTRLVETLFVQGEHKTEGPPEENVDASVHNFAGEDGDERCRSEFLRQLLRLIDQAIDIREKK